LIGVQSKENLLELSLFFLGNHVLDHHRKSGLLQFLSGTEAS